MVLCVLVLGLVQMYITSDGKRSKAEQKQNQHAKPGRSAMFDILLQAVKLNCFEFNPSCSCLAPALCLSEGLLVGLSVGGDQRGANSFLRMKIQL